MIAQQAMTIVRNRLPSELRDTAWLVAGAFIFAMVVTGVVSVAGITIRSSGWGIVTQIARWYAGGVGIYTMAVYLPMFIAHGYTRRAYLAQLPIYTVAISALIAGLVTVGFLVESWVYDALGWTQQLTGSRLFSSADDLGLIALQFMVLVVIFMLGGALAGAAFYRATWLGMVMLPPLIGVVMLTDAMFGVNDTQVLAQLVEDLGIIGEASQVTGVLGMSVLLAAILAAGVWGLARHLPMRNVT